MVRSVLQAGQAIRADLLAGGEVEDGIHLKAVLAVEHVVECLDVFPVLADLPGGVGSLLLGRGGERGGVG